MNYPRFEQYQLLDYRGNNNLIKKLRQKYLNYLLSKSGLKLSELERSVKKKKPIFLYVNRLDAKLTIDTLNNIKGKRKFFIPLKYSDSISQGSCIPIYKDTCTNLTEEQNEYLLKNFMFNPLNLNGVEFNIGEENESFLNKQFKTDKKINKIKADFLLGETDAHIHLKYKNSEYFVKKSDEKLIHPYKKLYLDIPFDEEYYNNLCKWPEWVERGYKLKSTQIEGIKFLKFRKRAFIFDRAGTGKTYQGIISSLEVGSKKTLVITQKGLKIQWLEHIQYFGKTASDFQENFLDLNFDADFHVIHFDQLNNNKEKEHKYDYNQFNYDMIIVDEAHGVKNLSGVRGAYVRKLISNENCEYVLGLTATPFETNEQVFQIYSNMGIQANELIPLSENDTNKKRDYLFNFYLRYAKGRIGSDHYKLSKKLKYYIVKNRILKDEKTVSSFLNKKDYSKDQIYYHGKDKVSFIPHNDLYFYFLEDSKKNRYKIEKKNGRTIINVVEKYQYVRAYGDSNTYELAQRLKYSFLCRTSNDIEGFPDIKIHTMNFNMGAVANSEYLRYKTELKEHYEKMKAKMGDNMTINEDLPILSKIREFLAKQAAEQTVNLARLKVKQGKKVIIFTHFQSEFDLLTQYLNEDAVWVHVTKKNRWNREDNDDIIKLFKTSSDKNILIGNIKTLGTGHNIPQADWAILNSPNWAYGEHMQAMSRPRRLNRTEPVDVLFWMIKDTEIEKVFETNERKRKNTNILLGLPIDFF